MKCSSGYNNGNCGGGGGDGGKVATDTIVRTAIILLPGGCVCVPCLVVRLRHDDLQA